MIENTYPLVVNLLTDILKRMSGLEKTLQDEAKILKAASSPDSISQKAGEKIRLIADLEAFNKQLVDVLRLENLPIDRVGIEQYFKNVGTAGLNMAALESDWQKIQENALLCKQLNDQNGASILLLSRHTERALQIIKGSSLVSNTYGPNGASQSELHSRSLFSV